MNEDELQSLREQLMLALRQVADPELGENIVDLGLVERLELQAEPGCAALTLIPTSATCPMADQIIDAAGEAMQALCPPGWAIEVDIDWELPWSPERLAPPLRARFGWT